MDSIFDDIDFEDLESMVDSDVIDNFIEDDEDAEDSFVFDEDDELDAMIKMDPEYIAAVGDDDE